jgi:hypothetical protein
VCRPAGAVKPGLSGLTGQIPVGGPIMELGPGAGRPPWRQAGKRGSLGELGCQ